MASEDKKENDCSSSGKSTRAERKVVTDPAGTVSSILSERTIEGYSGTFTILSCGLPPSFSGKFSSPSRQSSGDKKENVSSSSAKSTRVKRKVVTDPTVKGKVVTDPAVSSLPRAGTLGHQTPGSARSSGMGTDALSTTRTVLPSGHSGLTSSATSVSLVGVGRISANLEQNKLGSSTSTDFTGKHVVGGMGQQVPVMGREGVAAGSQIRQCEIGMNQNVLAGIGAVGPSSVGGSPVFGAGGSDPGNIQLPSTDTVGEQPGATAADLHKVWEGLLRIRIRKPFMRDTHISIWPLQAFCREASSINIAADWPPAMHIDELVSPDEVKIENYQGETVFLSFIAPDHHIVLERLARRKPFGVINLPTQTLLLSNFDSPGQMMGMVFPVPQLQHQQQWPRQPNLQHQQRQRQDRPSKRGAPAVDVEFVQCQFPSQFGAQQRRKRQRLLSAVVQAPAQSQLAARSRPQLMASGHQQLQEMPLATGQLFPPSQVSTQLQHQQQNLQPQVMPVATGQDFPTSQFSNEGDYQLQRPQPKGMPLATGQAFPPYQFPNRGQHQQQEKLPLATRHPFLPSQFSNQTIPPISLGQQQLQPQAMPSGFRPAFPNQGQHQQPQSQTLPFETGQPFLPSQFPNQTIPPISHQQQQQPQAMPSGFGSAFSPSQFPNQTVLLSMLLGQQQPEGMPSAMGQAFPRQSQTLPFETGQPFLPSQFPNPAIPPISHQQQQQPQAMPSGFRSAFSPSQFPNQTVQLSMLLGQQQPEGMPSAMGQAFPRQSQTLPFETGQPFLPSQFPNQAIPPISHQQQQQPQAMPSGFRSAFSPSQFPNQTVLLSMLLGQQQAEGMPSAMGQAFPRQSQGEDTGRMPGDACQSRGQDTGSMPGDGYQS